MARQFGKEVMLDNLDKKILTVLQRDASLPLEKIAAEVGSSKSPVWNRIRKMKESGVIMREVAIVDPEKIGQQETFFVQIQTDQHSSEWLAEFTRVVNDMPEIQEVHRLAGQIDYLLKVRVGSTKQFDTFYKRFVSRLSLFNVNSSLSMERIKETTAFGLELD